MPAESNYERDRQNQRVARRRANKRNQLIRHQREDVENIISVNHQRARLTERVQTFDQNKDNIQETAASERTLFWCNIVFFVAIAVYVTGEFFAQGDVAEWLAYQIGPLFLGGQAHAAETPVWLRRIAGGGFVILMLAATLLVKFVTTWFIKRFADLRRRVEAGDHFSYWKTTAGIWANYAARIGYLAAVTTFYVWLYGFAQDRAAIAAAAVAEQKAIESTSPAITLNSGRIQTSESPAKPEETVTIGGRLAYATGVVYAVIVLMHALVLVLPTSTIGQELPWAHFKRGAAQRKLHSLRDDQNRMARSILNRIYSVEGEDRDELIRHARPIARLLDEGAGEPVWETPGQPSDARPRDNPGDEAAGSVAAGQPDPQPRPGAPSAEVPQEKPENTAESEDVYAAIFGTPSPQQTT